MQLAETKLKVDLVERERDFYFDKLRDIEILCQMPELQKVPVRLSLDHTFRGQFEHCISLAPACS